MASKFTYDFQGVGTLPTWTWTSQAGVVTGGLTTTDPIHGVNWATYPGNVLFVVSYEAPVNRVELYRIADQQSVAELVATFNLPEAVRKAFTVIALDISPVFSERTALVTGSLVDFTALNFYINLNTGNVRDVSQVMGWVLDDAWQIAHGDSIYYCGRTEGGFVIRRFQFLPNDNLVDEYIAFDPFNSSFRYSPTLLFNVPAVTPVIYACYPPDGDPDVPPELINTLWKYDIPTQVATLIGTNVPLGATNTAIGIDGYVLSTSGAYDPTPAYDWGTAFGGAFWTNFAQQRPNFFNSFVSCVEKPGFTSDTAVPQTPAPPPPPTGLTNDHIANAIALTLNAADWDVTARPFHDFIFPGHTLVGATFEAGEPPTDRGYPFPADTGSVWFKFTVPDFGVPINFATAMVNYTVDPVTGLGVTFPPFKAYAEIFTSDGTIVGTDRTVYGGSTDSWTALWDWADNERVVVVMDVWPVAPGQEYYVRVTSFGANPDHPQSANYGPFDLCLEFVQQYVNQDVFAFETPIQLSPLPAQNVSYTWPDFYYIWNDPFTLEAWESTAYALPQPGATTIEPGTGSAWLAFTLPSFDARPRRLSVTPSFDLDLGGEVYNPSDFLFFIEIFDMDKNNVTTSMRPFDATLVADHAVHRLGYYGVLDMVASGAIYYVRVTSYGVNPASPTPAVFGELRLSVNLDLV